MFKSRPERIIAMNIRIAAEASGLSAKTIRYYEDVGLFPAPERLENGYRDYSARDIKLLRFLRRARELGFGVAECRKLKSLFLDPNRASADVHAIAVQKVAQIDDKLKEFRAMRRELSRLIEACPADNHPDCAILDELSHGPQNS
jgi:Cu(I)-responsive transcriptional regulator